MATTAPGRRASHRASPHAARGARRTSTCQHGWSPVLGSLYECWPCRTAHRCNSSIAATALCSSAASSASASASSARSRCTRADALSAAAAAAPLALGHSTGKSGGAAWGSACSPCEDEAQGEGEGEGEGGSWVEAWAEAEGGCGGGCVGTWRWGRAYGSRMGWEQAEGGWAGWKGHRLQSRDQPLVRVDQPGPRPIEHGVAIYQRHAPAARSFELRPPRQRLHTRELVPVRAGGRLGTRTGQRGSTSSRAASRRVCCSAIAHPSTTPPRPAPAPALALALALALAWSAAD